MTSVLKPKKKILTFSMFFSFVLILAGCSTIKSELNTNDPDKETEWTYINDKSEIENQSDEELIDIYKGLNKLPKEYANLVEYEIPFALNSASNEQEVIEVARERFTNQIYQYKNEMTDSSIVFQNDLYFIISATVKNSREGKEYFNTHNYISFNSQFVDFVAPYPAKNVEFSMKIKDMDKTKVYLDLYECSLAYSYTFAYSEIEEKEDEYLYSSYCFLVSYGDFGMKDCLYLFKRTYCVSTNGEVSFLGKETIQEAYGSLR